MLRLYWGKSKREWTSSAFLRVTVGIPIELNLHKNRAVGCFQPTARLSFTKEAY